MTTEEYLEALLNGSGHLNPLPIKTTETSPDYGGYVKINNKTYRVSAWVKKTKAGKKSLSLKLDEVFYGKKIKTI